MKEWVRLIPHPGYGNYGGHKKRCNNRSLCPSPVDQLDAYFFQHDLELRTAEGQYKAGVVTKERMLQLKQLGDKRLGRNLRKPLKPYRYKIYGPLYRFGASLVFRP